MKFNQTRWVLSWLLISAVMVSCNKEETAMQVEEAIMNTTNFLAVAGISGNVLTTSQTAAVSPDDSIYAVYRCAKRTRLDSVAVSSLPASLTSYLNTNYSGYSNLKGYVLETSSEVITGYIVKLILNEKPVAIEFDASGNFLRVLEQREGKDRTGKGWHHGGRFGHRDGKGRDTVALTALPATVLNYFTANYPADTLVAALRNSDSTLVVLSRQNGVFATVFTAVGNFIRRVQLHSKAGKVALLDVSTLPANVTTYLTATYPGYVLNKALSISSSGSVQGYVVVVDANNTRYALQFDAAGNFLRSVTIR